MRRTEWTLAVCAALAACASPGPADEGPPARPPFADARLGVEAAAARVVPGRSTRQEVQAALGPAETLRFDTGWEAWVYRSHDERGDAVDGPELVLLFEPGGVLQKARVRQGADPDSGPQKTQR
jgi:outer membrane protein assembly factor BamE (lipoprotein component of BamABCDE complex)